MDLSWMGWTMPTAIFFISIACALIIMLIWSVKAPQEPRIGILRIATTPGDRLFISLLGSAFICLFSLAMFGPPLWWELGACFIYGTVVFKWV
ncbi:MAG: DUF2160 domain-containing protein [Kordiimonadaceae bacterium]|jgi:predicted small integral membrane protein|nr:DUF2160 domain-containing protein [Kordiimonadaceae bacterium]MDB4219369.1 DUF2160 domain-containing protein [Emcibacteraceae bacterium]MBT6134117.1 DUF2160 domain-containing protein [Kordiimonadaceae bacterium]MBT6466307.1 DUF2160 domain-containing protein [Kordiimonadaceae bacterium]MBT7543869.1 DUF2160 domain-containing protein [Kordiimonadaceae bacterium]|tara:strand:- start:6240 stop:6518 length:279 start_codon:yes stop_codon:yes gene_type:complete